MANLASGLQWAETTVTCNILFLHQYTAFNTLPQVDLFAEFECIQFECHQNQINIYKHICYIYVVANVQIQLMYTLADRPANVYISQLMYTLAGLVANVYISQLMYTLAEDQLMYYRLAS